MAMPAARAQEPLPTSDFRGRARELGVRLDGVLSHGGIRLDLTAYTVTCDDVDVDLSPRQVELLALFLAAPRRVWSRDQLEWSCWGEASGSRRVDVQLCRLRARVGLDLLRNVRDRGWALR